MEKIIKLTAIFMVLNTFVGLTYSAMPLEENSNEAHLFNVHSLEHYDEASKTPSQKTAVRGGGPWGFFAEFLWVLNHLEYCIANNLKPVVHWDSKCSYYLAQGYNGSTNPWQYYFEPVSDGVYRPGNFLHTGQYYKRDNKFTTLWWYVQYIDNFHLLSEQEGLSIKAVEDHAEQYASDKFKDQRRLAYPVGKQHLYSKSFRHWVKENLLDRFIHIKLNIQQKIDTFYTNNMAGKKTVGLHLRGKHLGDEVIHVDQKYLFEEVNKFMDQGYQCFIATDLEPLLDEAQQSLRGPVIFYQAERFEQTTSPYLGAKKLHPQLGENVLIETVLLSRCDYFIHTISNVSTAALYFNPELEHLLIY